MTLRELLYVMHDDWRIAVTTPDDDVLYTGTRKSGRGGGIAPEYMERNVLKIYPDDSGKDADFIIIIFDAQTM